MNHLRESVNYGEYTCVTVKGGQASGSLWISQFKDAWEREGDGGPQLSAGVGKLQDGSGTEYCFEFREGPASRGVPHKTDLGGGEAVERSCYCALTLNKFPVEISKSQEPFKLFTVLWRGPGGTSLPTSSWTFGRVHDNVAR